MRLQLSTPGLHEQRGWEEKEGVAAGCGSENTAGSSQHIGAGGSRSRVRGRHQSRAAGTSRQRQQTRRRREEVSCSGKEACLSENTPSARSGGNIGTVLVGRYRVLVLWRASRSNGSPEGAGGRGQLSGTGATGRRAGLSGQMARACSQRRRQHGQHGQVIPLLHPQTPSCCCCCCLKLLPLT